MRCTFTSKLVSQFDTLCMGLDPEYLVYTQPNIKSIVDHLNFFKPRLFSEHSLQNEKKHQIMNVHTKWNCLVPFLSSLVN